MYIICILIVCILAGLCKVGCILLGVHVVWYETFLIWVRLTLSLGGRPVQPLCYNHIWMFVIPQLILSQLNKHTLCMTSGQETSTNSLQWSVVNTQTLIVPHNTRKFIKLFVCLCYLITWLTY